MELGSVAIILGKFIIPLAIINWLVYFWASQKSGQRISAWGNSRSFEGILLKTISVITVIAVFSLAFIMALILWNNYILTINPQV